jgi:hypothetical protein
MHLSVVKNGRTIREFQGFKNIHGAVGQAAGLGILPTLERKNRTAWPLPLRQ